MHTTITKSRLDQLVEEGWLISQVHPTLDLTIYNYSQKTQFESYWTPETLMCRGLVVNSDGKIVARPFPKFFNASEHAEGEIPELPFEVYEKMDGSLGIFFWYADPQSESLQPVFASRSSFTSEQALKGWELLQRYPYRELAYGHTHLFEIIYPDNRIVIDYGDAEKLVLLGVIETVTGREIPRKNIEEHLGEYFELVKAYNITDSWAHLKSQNEPNREGYVIRFSDGFRVKVKFDEYVRLHRIITNVSTVNVWEKLSESESLDELIERVPDEFYNWVRETARDLIIRYENIERDYLSYYEDILVRAGSDNRKAFAEEAKRYSHAGILFSMLDGRNYSKAIWKIIRPKWSKPFAHST